MILVGNASIQITSFTHSLKNSGIRNISLILSRNRNAAKSHDTLAKVVCKSSVLKLAEFYFFSKHESLKTRSLIGVVLGSNACKGGCQGLGTSSLNVLMHKVESFEIGDLDSDLTNALASKISATSSVIEACVEALMHEYVDELVNNNNARCKCNYLKD